MANNAGSMSYDQSCALYSPYGAYELKAKYQRNFALGTLLTLGFVVLILVGFYIPTLFEKEQTQQVVTAKIIKTVADLGPPPAIAKKPPQVKVNQPQVAMPKVGIPRPVADAEVVDDDVEQRELVLVPRGSGHLGHQAPGQVAAVV